MRFYEFIVFVGKIKYEVQVIAKNIKEGRRIAKREFNRNRVSDRHISLKYIKCQNNGPIVDGAILCNRYKTIKVSGQKNHIILGGS